MKLADVVPLALATACAAQPVPEGATAATTDPAAASAAAPSSGPQTTPPAAATPEEREVRALAEQAARDGGWDLSVYAIKDVTMERTRKPTASYVVFFEHAPPAGPGEHFTVLVDLAAKKTTLIPGR